MQPRKNGPLLQAVDRSPTMIQTGFVFLTFRDAGPNQAEQCNAHVVAHRRFFTCESVYWVSRDHGSFGGSIVLKFILLADSNHFTWRLVDVHGSLVAQPPDQLSWDDKQACLANIQLVKMAFHALIQDTTSAKPSQQKVHTGGRFQLDVGSYNIGIK